MRIAAAAFWALAGTMHFVIPRQVIHPNRNCTGRRAQRAGAGMRAKSFELTAMWMFAG